MPGNNPWHVRQKAIEMKECGRRQERWRKWIGGEIKMRKKGTPPCRDGWSMPRSTIRKASHRSIIVNMLHALFEQVSNMRVCDRTIHYLAFTARCYDMYRSQSSATCAQVCSSRIERDGLSDSTTKNLKVYSDDEIIQPMNNQDNSLLQVSALD